jgi:hypothetical protein
MTHRYNTRFQAKQRSNIPEPALSDAAHADIKLVQSYLDKIYKAPPGSKERLEEIISLLSYLCVSPLLWKTYHKFFTAVQMKVITLRTDDIPMQKALSFNNPEKMALLQQCEMVLNRLSEKLFV